MKKNYEEFDLKFSQSKSEKIEDEAQSISSVVSYITGSIVNWGACNSVPPKCSTSTDSRRSVCNFCTSSGYRAK